MEDVGILRLLQDVGEGLQDLIETLASGKYTELFKNPQQQLGLGVLLVVIAIIISATNL